MRTDKLLLLVLVLILPLRGVYAWQELFPGNYFNLDLDSRKVKVRELLKEHPAKFEKIMLLIIDSPEAVLDNARILVEDARLKESEYGNLITFLSLSVCMGKGKLSDKNIAFFKKLLAKAFHSKDIKTKLVASNTAAFLKYKEFAKDIAELCVERPWTLDVKFQLMEDLRELDRKKYDETLKLINKGIAPDSPDYYDSDEELEKLKRKSVGPERLLIDRLNSEVPLVRLMAIKKLRKKTGQNFGFNPIGTKEEREKAIAKWEEWLGRENKDK